jgi:hypothetical protein
MFFNYNMIRYPDLPCLIFGKDNNTPMELCETIVENKKILDNKTQCDFIK